MIPRSGNPFMDLVIEIIERRKAISLKDLLKEFNRYVLRGDMLCTTMDMVNIGGETFPACKSVLLVIDYLATCRYIDIVDLDNGDKLIVAR